MSLRRRLLALGVILGILAGLLFPWKGFLGTAPREPFVLPPGNFLLSPAAIGGKPGVFLLDTGTSWTIVTPALARTLPPASKRMHFLSQGLEFPWLQIPSVPSGGVSLASASLRRPEIVGVIDLEVFEEAWDQPLAGLLGWDVLGGFVIGFDLRKERVVLGQDLRPEEVLRQLGASSDRVEIPLQIQANRPCLEARSGGEELLLMLDTGSDATLLLKSAWIRLGGQAPSEGGWEGRSMIFGTTMVWPLLLPELRLGRYSLSDLEVKVSGGRLDVEAVLPRIDGLLGMDVLGRFLVVLDGPGQRLFLARRRPDPEHEKGK